MSMETLVYHQAPNVFSDLGIFIICLALAAFIGIFVFIYYVAAKSMQKEAKIDDGMSLVELKALKSYALSKGIDIDAEELKEQVRNKRYFRKKLQREYMDKFFEEKKE